MASPFPNYTHTKEEDELFLYGGTDEESWRGRRWRLELTLVFQLWREGMVMVMVMKRGGGVVFEEELVFV